MNKFIENILEDIFDSEFKHSTFKNFINHLFNSFDFSVEANLSYQLSDEESKNIRNFLYLGNFTDTEGESIDVLVVELFSGRTVERARSLQRNFIGKYLKNNLIEASNALVAFYSDDSTDWRLSFVKIETRLTERGVKVEIGTPPKRYSFVVGKNEPSHTARKQLLPLLEEEEREKILISEIEKAFSVERVTKEFYEEIAIKFTELVGGERRIRSRKIEEKGTLRLPSTSDDNIKKEFAVRLIGRLLFCWFLKKKVSDSNGLPLIPPEILSSDAVDKYTNYYHTILEPLFFEVLNTPMDKRKGEFRNNFWPNIPFLNGGLFEPHYDDFYEPSGLGVSKHINTLKIPDSWFKDLFEIFEIFNFTIDENTSIDIDLSVDPEMLGRIFENLLAEINPETGETARKATGSYYTPRPIVEYMVDESLKQYLITQTGIPEENLSKLLSYGDTYVNLKEPEIDAIIDALDRLKIIDPACGSGAFPMGILQKMLLILQRIDPESKKWLSKKLERIDNKVLRDEAGKRLKNENWDYVHKLGIIQSSIYGVDIQPIAADISKLRFFLSLIVDERIDDTKPNRGVEPLPNLEFKFVTTNSLIGLPKTTELYESSEDIEKLRKLREFYFTSYGEDKRKIEKEFLEIQKRMFESSLKWSAQESQTLKLSQWNPFSNEPSSWFSPDWMFGVRDGFDIVIANPPYIEFKKLPIVHKRRIEEQYLSAKGKYDLYVVFIELTNKLLLDSGIMTFINPIMFMKRDYGSAIRKFISKNYKIERILDFADIPVFEGVTNYTGVFIFSKVSLENYRFQYIKYSNIRGNMSIDEFSNSLYNTSTSNICSSLLVDSKFLNQDAWNFYSSKNSNIFDKLKNGTDLLGNIAELIFQGIASGKDEVFYVDIETIKSQKIETQLLFPLLKGQDVKRYRLNWSGSYVVYPYNENSKVIQENKLIKYFPNTYSYFKEKRKLLLGREYFDNSNKLWYELWNQRDIRNFLQPRIVVPEISKNNNFALCTDKFLGNTKTYHIVLKHKSLETYLYVLGLLNSSLIQFFYQNISVPKAGGFFAYKTQFLKLIPIKNSNSATREKIVELVREIVKAASANRYLNDQVAKDKVHKHESQIDQMVYELYDLTPEEIEVVEEFQ